MKIKIRVSNVEAKAELNNTKTAKIIYDSLPIKGIVNTWGDEIYFSINLDIKEENAQEEVEIGALAYWPPGKAFCIFFGKTPASINNKPRAASPVNIIGKVGNLEVFKKVKNGEEITIEKVF